MTLTKQQIISEIRRMALENGGTGPGYRTFSRNTGIKETAWKGRYWINWGQALTDAGYAPNSWQQAISEDEVLERLAPYVRELGRFPLDAELKMRRRTDAQLPDSRILYKKFGTLQGTADALLRFARQRNDEKLVAICQPRALSAARRRTKNPNPAEASGSVYLMKSGQFYKIGRSNSSARREYEISIQMPEKLRVIHEIKTDSPSALECYWHERFSAKRKNGEWFELGGADLKAFKSQRTFIFAEVFA